MVRVNLAPSQFSLFPQADLGAVSLLHQTLQMAAEAAGFLQENSQAVSLSPRVHPPAAAFLAVLKC